MLLCLLAAAGLLVSGCERAANREQLTKDVLKADPEFKWVLEKHRQLLNRIETYERELALKESTVEENIAQLRKDLATATTNVQQKVAEVRKQMDPEREKLQVALAMADEELRLKRFQRASLGRSLSQLKKALKNPKAGWSPEERARNDTQVRDMLADAQRFDQELEGLKRHMRLLKTKSLLLRF